MTQEKMETSRKATAATVRQLNAQNPSRPYGVGAYNPATGNTRIMANISGQCVIV